MAVPDVSIRVVRPDDAPLLSRLEVENRVHLSAGGPLRSDDYVSVEGQRTLIDALLEQYDADTCVPWVIELDRTVVGRILLAGIVRGGFSSASVGYWVCASVGGRGIASAALALAVEQAFGELGLHRLEAATTLANVASARVLAKAGFEEYGVAPAYLFMRDGWTDHRMFQLLNDDWVEPS